MWNTPCAARPVSGLRVVPRIARLAERDTEASPDVAPARRLLESTYLTLLNLLKRAHILNDDVPMNTRPSAARRAAVASASRHGSEKSTGHKILRNGIRHLVTSTSLAASRMMISATLPAIQR